MRVLTLRELNRATLARQLLLERRPLSVPRAIERVACLQAQWPPAPYVGLWSRLAGFDRRTLERLLHRRAVVKATLMRGTLHLATAPDYPVFATALNGLRSWGDEISADADAVAAGLRALCLERPITIPEALEHIEREHGHRDLHARRVWYVARRRAHLHHDPETALWTSRPEGRYVAIAEPVELDPVAARVELARRYLAAFGPATRSDLAGWAGLRQLASGSHTHTYWPLVAGTDPMRVAVINLECLAALVLFTILTVVAWRRLGAPYGLFSALSLAIPLSMPSDRWPLLSLPRFGLVIFPLFLALASIGRNPRAHTAIVGVSALFLGVAVSQWALWQWVA